MFPAPFDHTASAALLRNIDQGRAAEMIFDADCQRSNRRWHIQIHEVSEDHPELEPREVVDGIFAGPNVAAAVLTGFIQELLGADDDEE